MGTRHWFGVLLAVLAAGPVAGQSCGGRAAPLRDAAGPRSWIPATLAFYAVNRFDGVFKVVPRDGAVIPIGHHAGDYADIPVLSPSHRWLTYGFRTGETSMRFVYDTTTGQETALTPWSGVLSPLFSPDERKLAFVREGVGGSHLVTVDLATLRKSDVPLAASREGKPVLFEPDSDDIDEATWTQAGDRVLFHRASQDDAAGWSADPATGRVTKIAVRETRQGGETGYEFLADGRSLGASCRLCGVGVVAENVGLEGGARIGSVHDDGEGPSQIVLFAPGAPPRTLARSAPPVPDARGHIVFSACAPPRTEIVATFGGRFVLYRVDEEYRLYGLREDQSVPLWRGFSFVRW